MQKAMAPNDESAAATMGTHPPQNLSAATSAAGVPVAGTGGLQDFDEKPHFEAYENFVALTKWSTIGVVVALVLMAIFLL